MNDTLVQKTVADAKRFTLESEYIHIQSRHLGERWDYNVRYEDIGFEKAYKTEVKNKYAPYLFVPLIGLCIWIIVDTILASPSNVVERLIFSTFGLLFFLAIFLFSYFERSRNYLYLTGGEKTIEMLADIPNKDTVNRYIEMIYDRKRSVYKDQYFQKRKHLLSTYEHEQWLNYLLEIKAITESEKEALFKEVNGTGENWFDLPISYN